jgi:hypothetical protein
VATSVVGGSPFACATSISPSAATISARTALLREGTNRPARRDRDRVP